MIKIKTKEELDKFITNEGVRCVKFSADWCSPCRTLGSTINGLTLEETNGVEFAEIDVDEADEDLVESYSIRNIPVMVYFKDGLVSDKTIGLLTKPQLLEKINEIKNK